MVSRWEFVRPCSCMGPISSLLTACHQITMWPAASNRFSWALGSQQCPRGPVIDLNGLNWSYYNILEANAIARKSKAQESQLLPIDISSMLLSAGAGDEVQRLTPQCASSGSALSAVQLQLQCLHTQKCHLRAMQNMAAWRHCQEIELRPPPASSPDSSPASNPARTLRRGLHAHGSCTISIVVSLDAKQLSRSLESFEKR